ncbi:hypothetical protein I3760_04G116900 [Carya illinoinensis]|uniref:Uncharacterized protein n=1 Tax=Carya illinoinensis TaxID=32201 RepID=A0A922F866_CARIL|nr:hypothetical protein I3760_04G116900 [Carya illinoinensis]KAG6717751.1 hypothetical protein I3842_04G116100 [Carya illinoinensis]
MLKNQAPVAFCRPSRDSIALSPHTQTPPLLETAICTSFTFTEAQPGFLQTDKANCPTSCTATHPASITQYISSKTQLLSPVLAPENRATTAQCPFRSKPPRSVPAPPYRYHRHNKLRRSLHATPCPPCPSRHPAAQL